MPMYEFRCSACGHAIERYSAGRSADQEAGACPKCHKGLMKKVFSTFASSCCSGGGASLPASGGCGGGSSQFS